MTKTITVKSEILGEEYYKIEHSSGLTLYVYPKLDFNSTYAVFCTEYGSINDKFTVNGKHVEVPAGIAHYLEHKMFESQDGDAFLKYAKTGASANAYTSFDKTAYLFSTSDNFKESFEILVDLIQEPYFTDENVEKERGIISQEIKMYDDDPDWKLLTNLLQGMYHFHPVRLDIAGTVKSISEITKEKLYECYNAYYNLHNLTLAVVGKVSIDNVLEVLDKKLSMADKVEVENQFPEEPIAVKESLVTAKFDVPLPLFCLGFKEQASETQITSKELATNNVLLEIIGGRSSELYKTLIEKNLINSFSFDYECFEGPMFLAEIFSGQSQSPKDCAKEICSCIDNLRSSGISEDTFNMARNDIYGRTIAMYNNNQSIGTALINSHFSKRTPYEYLDALKSLTSSEVESYLKSHLDTDNITLSVIN